MISQFELFFLTVFFLYLKYNKSKIWITLDKPLCQMPDLC